MAIVVLNSSDVKAFVKISISCTAYFTVHADKLSLENERARLSVSPAGGGTRKL